MVPSYRNAGLLYLIFFIVFTIPYWLLGDVISPHKQIEELAAPELAESGQLENRLFSDYTNSYAPEIYGHLSGTRSGRLSLWTNQNELGRPVLHLSVFSPTYFLTWLISAIVDSPEKVITYLSLSFCFLAGFFVLILCKELSLSPLAAIIAAINMATLPSFMYWITFPMVSATYTWSIGVIYAVTRLSKKTDMLGWTILALCIFSLLMAARKQAIIYQSYIIGGYIAYLLFQQIKSQDNRLKINFVLSMASAVIAGGLLALPMIIDLMHNATMSARLSTDISFFADVLPDFNSIFDVMRFLVLGTFPWVYGNPVSTDYPIPYSGLSATVYIVFFTLICLMLRLRETWGWWLAVAFFSSLTFIPPIFVFAVQHLGFNLSRSFPLGHMIIPLILITAYGADAIIRREKVKQHSQKIIMAILCLILFLIIAVSYGWLLEIAIDWKIVFLLSAMITLLVTQIGRTWPVFLIFVLIIQVATISFPLMLRQNPKQIATTSPLIEKINSSLPVGSRFAIAEPGLPVLPPNLNARVGLASIHSYNSLSSTYYHKLIDELGGSVKRYGRVNRSISPDYSSTSFWMSNIGLILATSPISHENLEYIGEVHGVSLHKVLRRMGDSLQIFSPLSQKNYGSDDMNFPDPRKMRIHSPLKTLDQGDMLEFDVKKGQSSVLVLSQKYHRDWQAQAYIYDNWLPAKTTVINGIFQGVFLTKDTQRVRIEYKPYSRYAWIVNYFWLLMLMIVLYRTSKIYLQSKYRGFV